MKIDGIMSMREYRQQVFTDIVFEWEEDLAQAMGIPVIRWSTKYHRASCLLSRLPRLELIKHVMLGRKKRYLRFVMNALDDTPLFNHRSCIPIIIDFFVKPEDMQHFISIYDKCEYVFITSRQAFDILSEYDLPFKIVHFPLTLSDRYLHPETRYEKKYSLTLFGAQIYDEVIKRFIDRYCDEHPDFTYLYKERDSNTYVTNRGENVIDAQGRDEYLELLRATRVVVYSTPGIRGRDTANGYDQVTPKFLEYLSAQCQIIPRYSQNSDTAYFSLSDYAPSVDSYDTFAHMLDYYLSTPVDMDRSNALLKRHLTSKLPKIIADL